MKDFKIYFIGFAALFLWLLVMDYFRSGSLIWIENAIQSLFIVFWMMFFQWGWKSKDYRKSKPTKEHHTPKRESSLYK
ncbi:hypothetical protein [Halobacillus sp. B23F22_1]|uniref:hypothetical protein n=1 Tax=Halobacillus sp. B23F22_1 TaxID=3459514 RepID=UPI00373FB884